jgi:hypothetical protein
MVHIEHTSITSRAMMAPLRFKNIAHEAISSSFILVVAQMESPEDRNLSWVGGHGLEK